MSKRPSSISRGVDWIALTSYISLLIVGWMMLYAAVYSPHENQELFSFASAIGKQTIWVGISLIAGILVFTVDSSTWARLALPMYGISILLLVLVLIIGKEINGAKAWFSIGGATFQPSEFAKLATALFMSSYLSGYKRNLKSSREILTVLGIIILPQILILLQPDAGSAMIFLAFFITFYRFGLPSYYYGIGALIAISFILSIMYDPLTVVWIALAISLVFIAVGEALTIRNMAIALVPIISAIVLYQNKMILESFGLILLPFIYFIYNIIRSNRSTVAILTPVFVGVVALISFGTRFLFNALMPHQQDRINVWLRPELCDPHGSLYNIIQSKLAIGSGGFSGKGFLQGDMTKLNYVPEQTTDFIFCTVGEEQGFAGVVIVIILFSLLLFRSVVIAERARNKFIMAYAYSVTGIFFIHFFFNIGMTMGVMPVIGIPLPFLSKGGSSLLVFSVMIAILLKMDVSRFRGNT